MTNFYEEKEIMEEIYDFKLKDVILESEIYANHQYVIISRGTHPCAYVKVKDLNTDYESTISCNGG